MPPKWDSLSKPERAKLLTGAGLPTGLAQLNWSGLQKSERKKLEKGKGWREKQEEVRTDKGIEKKAPIHREVAIKKEASEANNIPMQKPAHTEQAQAFDWQKINNYPNTKQVYLGQHGVFERLEGKDKEKFIKALSQDITEHGSWEKAEENAREFFITKGVYYDEKGLLVYDSKFPARAIPVDLKHIEGNKYHSASAEKDYYRIDEKWYIDKPKKMDDSDIDYLYNREIKATDFEGELNYYKIIHNSAGFGKGLGTIYQAHSPKEALEILDKAHVSGYPVSIKRMTDEEYKLSSVGTSINIEKRMLQHAKENLIKAEKEKDKAWIANSKHDIKTRQENIDKLEREKEDLLEGEAEAPKKEPPNHLRPEQEENTCNIKGMRYPKKDCRRILIAVSSGWKSGGVMLKKDALDEAKKFRAQGFRVRVEKVI